MAYISSEDYERVVQLAMDSIGMGTFTPLLGPGASSLRFGKLDEAPWNEVLDRMSLILAHLTNRADERYLSSQAEAHLEVVLPDKKATRLPSSGDSDDLLLPLQIGLVRLGAALVGLFGQRMIESRQCVSELVDYEVEVLDKDREALWRILLDLVDAAKRLARGTRESPSVDKASVPKEETSTARSPDLSEKDHVQLPRKLAKLFSPDELEQLCFELGIDYKDLRGEVIAVKALELVRFLDRRGELSKLIECVERERPNVQWRTKSSVATDAGSPLPASSWLPGVEADAIYEKLLMFACRMIHPLTVAPLADQFPEVQPRLLAHGERRRELQLMHSDEPVKYLKLAELAWLEDLLWYTLSYKVPAYPTTAELAFKLSLTARPGLVQRGELAHWAELLQNGKDGDEEFEFIRSIQEWLTFCEDRDLELTKFHSSVAAALSAQYRQYQQDVKTRRVYDRERLPPIAFISNYDRRLEKALECIQVPYYHVALPVRVQRSKSSGSDSAWLFYTFALHGSKRHVETIYTCEKWQADDLNDYVLGPIIVKVHGSPLEVLPDHNKVSEEQGKDPIQYQGIQHLLILSESRYLLALVGDSSYPAWLLQELRKESRELWFFGYSLADWSVRLNLFEGMRYLGDEQDGKKQTRIVLSPRFDILRGAILRALKMVHRRGDPVAFGEYLSRQQLIRNILSETCGRVQK
jgi:hypothetical protein